MSRSIIASLAIAAIASASACGGLQSNSAPNAEVKSNTGPSRSEETPKMNETGATTDPKESKALAATVELHGVKFVVESPNSAAGNKFTVTPSGLKESNEPFTQSVDGDVYGAEVGDLNIDQSPEIYVFVRERSGLKRSTVYGFAANAKKSMSHFALADPDVKSKEYAGYNGEDEFAVVENVLSRRFPIFEGTGADAKKTGKTRIVQYKIKPGEASWQFYVFRSDQY